jgi:hypothetical protein
VYLLKGVESPQLSPPPLRGRCHSNPCHYSFHDHANLTGSKPRSTYELGLSRFALPTRQPHNGSSWSARPITTRKHERQTKTGEKF